MSWIGAAVLGGSVISGISSAYGANKAADAQVSAQNKAIAAQKEQQAITRGDLAPYRGIGEQATGDMGRRLSELTSPITMTQEDIEATPGYQFTRTQGLKAAQNSAAARGLGVSGAALKGAETFAAGLADQTFNTRWNQANTNQTNAYTRLKGLIDTGVGAAGVGGQIGQSSAQNIGNINTGIGNAQAGGIMGGANAVGGMGQDLAGYAAWKAMQKPAGSPMQGLYGATADTSAPNVSGPWA
jgi:hypothetical protein